MAKINWLASVKHESKSGHTYTVKIARSQASCSCPAWRFQKVHPAFRSCKHIDAVKNSMRAIGIAA